MAISYSLYVAYAGLRMSTQDERVPMTSTLQIQYLITLQVSRYCPLVLQSCNVAAVPVIEHRVMRCLSCVSALHIWMARDAADIQNLRPYYTEAQAFFRSSEASNLNSYYTWRRTIRRDIRYNSATK